MTRYVEIRFRPEDRRSYTYHCNEDALELAPGTMVEVDARGGRKTVEVVAVTTEPPPYHTKPILGLAPAPDEGEAEAARFPNEAIPFGGDDG